MVLKNTNYSMVIILSLLFISSCTLHKRIDKKGYLFEVKHKSSKENKNVEVANIESNENEVLVEELDIQTLNSNNSKSIKLANESNVESDELSIENNENEIISPLDKQMSLREIYKMPKASIKNEIKKEILKIKNNKALTPRGRMSIIIKLAIILTGLGLVLLIVSFWLWLFTAAYSIDPYSGTSEPSSKATLPLVIGLVTLAAGLFLFILSFLAN
jgi:preprotein translocase subunit SecF